MIGTVERNKGTRKWEKMVRTGITEKVALKEKHLRGDRGPGRTLSQGKCPGN